MTKRTDPFFGSFKEVCQIMYAKNSGGCGRADQWQQERKHMQAQQMQPRREYASVSAMRTEPRLARAYVPFQTFGERFAPNEALRKGTLFQALYQPYC